MFVKAKMEASRESENETNSLEEENQERKDQQSSAGGSTQAMEERRNSRIELSQIEQANLLKLLDDAQVTPYEDSFAFKNQTNNSVIAGQPEQLNEPYTQLPDAQKFQDSMLYDPLKLQSRD